jgi:hypothetical protein
MLPKNMNITAEWLSILDQKNDKISHSKLIQREIVCVEIQFCKTLQLNAYIYLSLLIIL